MRKHVNVERLRTLSRLAVVLGAGSLAVACSDSMRLAGVGALLSPPGTVGGGLEPSMTGSISAPRTAVHAQPLPAPEPWQAPAPAYSDPYALPRPRQSAPVQREPLYARGATSSDVAQVGSGGWTAQGGTPVTVGPGENLNIIANRYGVPAAAVLSANGLSKASQVTPGRRVIIPVYDAAAVQNPARARSASRNESTARLDAPKSVPARRASGRDSAAPAKAARAETQPVQKQAAQAPTPPSREAALRKDPDETASIGNAGDTDFRWPVRGRIISAFGGASGNEGINIAVPEGTLVKAAEAGTVAYAGNEVKGYGNLILIRHDNGYVSAYAHNGDITVKRGEKVKRGQVIAKSGQSGNVTSPQLHFEIRKGSTPVDPMPHLSN
jgi:murein DD-endopeptidase MepM/ murein hydrolase activator NlpD